MCGGRAGGGCRGERDGRWEGHVGLMRGGRGGGVLFLWRRARGDYWLLLRGGEEALLGGEMRRGGDVP